MVQRYVSIWFRHLTTDWFAIRRPELRKIPFVVRVSDHGRMVVSAANAPAQKYGIHKGMVMADARALLPTLEVRDDPPELIQKLLTRVAEWCIRFTPVAAIDTPDGVLLDVTGCSHLWGGDELYLKEIISRLERRGYQVQAAMADTIGAAWAIARFGRGSMVVESGKHQEVIKALPPESLRLDDESVIRLRKLGLLRVGQLINLGRTALRRRFGPTLLIRLDQSLGKAIEAIHAVLPEEPYSERLPCLEPISTATGIEIALDNLLMQLCFRLRQDQKGLRSACLKCFRIDGKVEQVSIGTHRPSHHVAHLFKLFSLKLSSIEPELGIELFVLEAPKVEDLTGEQEKIWESSGDLADERISELIDRLTGKVGTQAIRRFLPAEHYWPERSVKVAASVSEVPTTEWQNEKIRPVRLLQVPEIIEVTAPIPDYPPMLFRHQEKIHQVVKADGPERIEQEWWLQQGQHRDYYRVEDESGHRYWIFRLGHYHDKNYRWFLHGYFE
jgi:protein ImuB